MTRIMCCCRHWMKLSYSMEPSFNLGLHKYQGDNYSPRGHKYIREFECEKVPTTIYRVGGVVLKKEKLFVHHENRILIRYTLLDAHSATTLRLRPFLAFRSVREYTHENAQASREYQVVTNGIKTCMYPGYPELYMQLNKKNEFIISLIGIEVSNIRKSRSGDMILTRIYMFLDILKLR